MYTLPLMYEHGFLVTTYEPRQSAHILESLETKNVHRQI